VFPQGLQPPPHRSSLPLIYGPQTFDWATDRGDYQITVRVYDNDSRVPNTYLWDYEVANGSFMPRYYEDDFVGLPFLEIALEASFVDEWGYNYNEWFQNGNGFYPSDRNCYSGGPCPDLVVILDWTVMGFHRSRDDAGLLPGQTLYFGFTTYQRQRAEVETNWSDEFCYEGFPCRIEWRTGSVVIPGGLEGGPVAIKLEQEGSTVISTDGNYSEDTTIRVTAVDPLTGQVLTTFSGSVNVADLSGTYYRKWGFIAIFGDTLRRNRYLHCEIVGWTCRGGGFGAKAA